MQFAGDANVNPRAATWRDANGEIRGTAWAGTMCLFPRKPTKLKAVSAAGGELWVVIVESHELLVRGVAHQLRRRARGVCWQGFISLDDQHVALISTAPPHTWLPRDKPAGVRWPWSKLLLHRGKRAWAGATVGMLTPRDEEHEGINRFYIRALPPAEKEVWRIETRGGISRNKPEVWRGTRAVRGNVALVPPEAWKPPKRPRRRKQPTLMIAGVHRTPESIGEAIKSLMAGAELANPTPTAAGVRRPAALTLKVIDAAKPHPPSRKENRSYFDRGVTKDLNYSKDETYAEWGARMAKFAKDHPRDG
jgi:hypothetical protein